MRFRSFNFIWPGKKFRLEGGLAGLPLHPHRLYGLAHIAQESPAISLISLHLANVFLATLTTTALFRSGGKGQGFRPPTVLVP